jgi:hypothetical protein
MVAAKRVIDWQQRIEDIAAEIESESDDCPDVSVRMMLEGITSELSDLSIQLEECTGDE